MGSRRLPTRLGSEFHVIDCDVNRARGRGTTVGNLRNSELELDADDLGGVGRGPVAEGAERRGDDGRSRRRNRDLALGWEAVAAGNTTTWRGICRGNLVEGLDLQLEVAPRRRARQGERDRTERADICAGVEAQSGSRVVPRRERSGDVKILVGGANRFRHGRVGAGVCKVRTVES